MWTGQFWVTGVISGGGGDSGHIRVGRIGPFRGGWANFGPTGAISGVSARYRDPPPYSGHPPLNHIVAGHYMGGFSKIRDLFSLRLVENVLI